jgi:hypothetical protein
MAIPRYDVLKRDSGGLLWIEAVDDLESARLRIQELSSASNGEYLLFDQNTGQAVDRREERTGRSDRSHRFSMRTDAGTRAE